jgi:transcription antitermination factor NusB
MRRRTQARELALQLLYQVDLLKGNLSREEREKFLAEHAEAPEVREYARELAAGVEKHRPAIDAAIDEVATNWELGRMPVIDRNILRMGIFELLHRDDIPPKVAINEAVDLAKKYSTKNSSAFVNGILDRIKELYRRDPAPPAGAPKRAQGEPGAPEPS